MGQESGRAQIDGSSQTHVGSAGRENAFPNSSYSHMGGALLLFGLSLLIANHPSRPTYGLSFSKDSQPSYVMLAYTQGKCCKTSTSKRNRPTSLGLDSATGKCHFHHILFAKAVIEPAYIHREGTWTLKELGSIYNTPETSKSMSPTSYISPEYASPSPSLS